MPAWMTDFPQMILHQSPSNDGFVWAGDPDAAEVLWIVVRPGYLLMLFTAGWAVNVSVFGHYRIDYSTVLGLSKDEVVTPQRLWVLALMVGVGMGMVCHVIISQPPSPASVWVMLLTYLAMGACLFIWLPPVVAKHCRWRIPLARALWRCLVPDQSREIPFVEVLVADGLTSLAKVFFDLALGSCVALTTTDLTPALNSHFASLHGVQGMQDNSTAAPVFGSQQMQLGQALKQCKQSPLPFLALAMPFLIRAKQCIITSRHAADNTNRDLQRVNLLKYLSALPIIVFSFGYARIGTNIPWLVFDSDDFEAMWAMAAVINSIFSFLWDMVMDWGLLQPAPWSSPHFGLRPVLLFRDLWGFYHFSILLNLLGRTLWSLRWSPQATVFLGTFFLGSLQQAAEVLRRCLWNVLRVEWECIKKNVHRTDKHFSV